MPISSVTNRVSYQCDGTSAVFAFPYRFHAHADLQGFIYNSSLSEPNIIRALELNASGGFGFTVSATADQSNVYPNGGSVVLNSAPNAQCVIVVFRSSAITNGFSISKNGPIPSSGINNAFDYLTMLIQRGQDLLTRSVRLPDGYPRTFDPTLPNTIVASSVLMFNSGATGFAIGPTAYEIANAQSSALSAANSQASANASAVAANSAAVSAGNSAFNANSAAVSIQNAVSLIGSTAFWGAEAQSSALSAFNSQVLANSGALSASNSATLANSAAVSAGAQAVSAGSAALSANNAAANIAVIQASGDLIVGSGAGSAARLARTEQNSVLMVHGSSSQGVTWRRPPMPIITELNSSSGATFSLSPNVSYLRIRMVGGGGSGGSAAANGINGGSSIFGTSLLVPALVCMGGGGADNAGLAPNGGPAFGGDFNIAGSAGNPGQNNAQSAAGNGGASYFGGAGAGAQIGAIGRAAGTNSGSGGGGSGSSAVSRAGGGAGGYLEKLIVPTSSSYIYTVGDGGPAVSGGGAAGGAGKIIIEQYFV